MTKNHSGLTALIAAAAGAATLLLAGCGKTPQPATEAAAPTAPEPAADAAATEEARAAELAAKEQDIAAREAALQQQQANLEAELARRDAENAAAAAAAAKTAAAAKKPAAKPATTTAASAPKAAPPPPTPITVPAGTTLEIALTANVNTKKVKVGDPVQARLASDLVVGGRKAASAGAAVTGSVSKVVSGTDKVGGTPELGLAFNSLVVANGSTVPISAHYSQKGVSETGKDTAKIVGGAAAGAIIGHQVSDSRGSVVGGILGGAAGTAAAHKTGGDVKVTAGTVLNVATESSFTVTPK